MREVARQIANLPGLSLRGVFTHAGHAYLQPARAAVSAVALSEGESLAATAAALRQAGKSPLLDRGAVLVSMAAAITLGATSMSDIAVLAHLAARSGLS